MIAAFRRSRELVRGNFWRVLGLLAPIVIVGGALGDWLGAGPLVGDGFLGDWLGAALADGDRAGVRARGRRPDPSADRQHAGGDAG